MKAIFVSYDQAHQESVLAALSSSMQRGFTCWQEVQGKGSVNGEPHMGSHAWPGMNSAIFVACEDANVPTILERLRKIDAEKPMLGLRAFVLPIEQVL